MAKLVRVERQRLRVAAEVAHRRRVSFYLPRLHVQPWSDRNYVPGGFTIRPDSDASYCPYFVAPDSQ